MPSYPCAIHGPIVTSSGQRKHLNLLLEDQSVENTKTYRREQTTATAFSKQHRTAGQLGGTYEQHQQQTGHAPSEELATKVGKKRTPSGNFFSTVNSALVEKQSPPNYYAAEDITHTAAATLNAARGRRAHADEAPASPQHHYHSDSYDGGYSDGAPSPSGGRLASPHSPAPAMYKFSSSTTGAAASLHQAAMSRSSSQRAPAPWLMPWETGDRATGRRVADMVRSKRTPSGAFSVLALAKANK